MGLTVNSVPFEYGETYKKKFQIRATCFIPQALKNYIGPRGKVSEVLNRKRSLTLPMIRKLHKNLNIPANVLIHETRKQIA